MCFTIGVMTPFAVYVLCHYIVNIWMLWLKYDALNIPPFNCVKCLNFWANIVVGFWVFLALNFNFYQLLPHYVVTILITISLHFKKY